MAVPFEKAPDEPEYVTITFEHGDPVAVNGEALSPAQIMVKLNELGRKHGICLLYTSYSGGLDTSVILKWLQVNYGCEVITMTADVGQEDDLNGVDEKALRTGADVYKRQRRMCRRPETPQRSESIGSYREARKDLFLEAGILTLLSLLYS